MSRFDYPETVTEILDDRMTFQPTALAALRTFRASKPWRGSHDERVEKVRQLNRELARAYGISEPELIIGLMDGGSSGASGYAPSRGRITLVGKLSVITFLHEFAHARGFGERGATRWSINLFRRIFPRQYGRLIHVGHTLVRPEDIRTDVRGAQR